MKNLAKLRTYIPIITDWIESNLIVRADIYKKRKLVDSFEVIKITVSDILEITARGRKGCYIYFDGIHNIELVNGVCTIAYDDLTIVIARQ